MAPLPTASLLASKSKLLVEIHVVSASDSSTMTVGSASTNSASFDEQIQALSCFDTTPPISTPPASLGVYTTRQPYATVIDGGVGREGSRVRRLFTRCPKALAAANIMDHVLLRLPRSLSGGADRAPSFILHQS